MQQEQQTYWKRKQWKGKMGKKNDLLFFFMLAMENDYVSASA